MEFILWRLRKYKMNLNLFKLFIKKEILQYKFPVKAKITKVYTEKDKYFIDCKELDFNDNELDVIYPKVEIPKIWGGDKTAILCLPSVDTIVSVGFYNGNIHHPFILNIMDNGFDIEHNENELIIVIDTTEFRIKEKTISIKIGETTEYIIEENKVTQKMGVNSEIIHDDSSFKIGGEGATESIVKGDTVKAAFAILLGLIQGHTHEFIQAPSGTGTTLVSSALGGAQNPFDNALSDYGKVK